ncbi:hypothetical protein EWM64_g6797 [Hericium alpestre]|uniref:Charged multivesicular body protein 6 n=1 Tax=Hericium alpestre TaxID=135208 RepID=A0A4Y9ZUP9_9AGAM|nr:hypothetical protein EWM64_g6797 [Hericium alpestre]
MGANQSTPKVTAQDRAILDMKIQRDKLKQYQKKIQTILDREHEIAKQHLETGQKERALIALRRRKYQESLMMKTDGQLESLEQLVSTIEFSLVEVSVLHGLKQGNDVLKEIHREINIDSVEKLLDETVEQGSISGRSITIQELGDMLANNLSLDEEDAVQAELKELQRQAEITLPEAPVERPVELPTAPTREPVAPISHEEPPEAKSASDQERVPVLA